MFAGLLRSAVDLLHEQATAEAEDLEGDAISEHAMYEEDDGASVPGDFVTTQIIPVSIFITFTPSSESGLDSLLDALDSAPLPGASEDETRVWEARVAYARGAMQHKQPPTLQVGGSRMWSARTRRSGAAHSALPSRSGAATQGARDPGRAASAVQRPTRPGAALTSTSGSTAQRRGSAGGSSAHSRPLTAVPETSGLLIQTDFSQSPDKQQGSDLSRTIPHVSSVVPTRKTAAGPTAHGGRLHSALDRGKSAVAR